MKRLRFLVISSASICNKFAQRFYRKHEVIFFGNDSYLKIPQINPTKSPPKPPLCRISYNPKQNNFS